MSEQPSTDVATTEAHVAHQGALSERMRYAQALAAAGLLPAAYRKQPANVLLAMEYAAALQVPNMTVIQGVHIVDGKPTASSALVGALVRKAGHRLRVTGDDQRAVCEIVRADDPDFTFRSEWTMDRARAAGLTGKGTWKQYPASMLKARAITECARDACPEALSGVQYTPEELGADVPDDWAPETSGAVSEPHRQDDASAAPEPDVIDAEIVEDSDGAGVGEDPAPSAPDPNVALSKRTGPAPTPKQVALMWVLLGERFAGEDAQREFLHTVVTRDWTSTRTFTATEVRQVIDALGGTQREAS